MLPKILSNKLETTTLYLNRTHLVGLSGSAAETYIHINKMKSVWNFCLLLLELCGKIQKHSLWYKWIKHRRDAKSLLPLSMPNLFLRCCPFEIYWVVIILIHIAELCLSTTFVYINIHHTRFKSMLFLWLYFLVEEINKRNNNLWVKLNQEPNCANWAALEPWWHQSAFKATPCHFFYLKMIVSISFFWITDL